MLPNARRFACRLIRSPLTLALLFSLVPAGCGRDESGWTPEEAISWLEDHAIRLQSIDPGQVEFSDLEALKLVLDGTQVVMLGEQSHGDGATFSAKIRLIKFLHQKMGFDVLAFESGFYDCRNAWRRMELGEDVHAQFRRCVFGIWTRGRQVQPLIDYLASALDDGSPLELTGFDSQFTGAASREDLVGELQALVSNLDDPTVGGRELDSFFAFLQRLADGDYVRGNTEKPDSAAQEAFRATAASLGREVASAATVPEPTREFWVQLLRSTASHSRSAWDVDYSDPGSTPEAFGIRDRQMGENLLWLAREKYPARKIIVWAATVHNARNLGEITVADSAVQELYRQFHPMGDYVVEALGAGAYSLGFTAYEGSAGAAGMEPTELESPTSGSLEDLMARAGLENAIVDFRDPPEGGDWLRTPHISRPLGYSEMEADWGSVMDGMVFTRTMTPSEATSGG